MARTKKSRMYEQQVRATMGKRLRQLREGRGLSQAQLAAKITTCTQASLSNYESGRRAIPVFVLLDLCRVLDMPNQHMLRGL